MAEVLHVSTRKGLFTVARGTAGWEVERVAFLGEPITFTLQDPRDGAVYAAVSLGHFGQKLHRSDDRGRTFTEVAAPAFPKAAEGEAEAPAVDLLWTLAAGGTGQPGLLWAGTIPGGLFRSTDRGATWSLVRGLWDRPERKAWMGGGYDHPGIHSVCVDPRDPRRLHCGVSTGGVWYSEDGGESWGLRATGMYAEYMPPERREDPNAQDVHHLAQAPSAPDVIWAQHHNGVFRTVDGGRRWSEVTAIRPSKFGFTVAVHPRDPETAWFVPGIKDEKRVPVDGALVVARTSDGGRSFELLRQGLPQRHAYDLAYRHGLDVDPSGERLAMGTTTGNLWVSEDAGASWAQVSSNLPPIAAVAFGVA